MRCDVPSRFAEYGTVAIDAQLLGQPPGLRPIAHAQRVRKSLDRIALFDVMLLLLKESAYGRAHRKILRCLQANLVAVHLVAVSTLDVLGRVDRVARVIVEIPARLLIVNRISDGIVRVVGVSDVVAPYEAARIGQIEIADLAL